MFIYKIICFLLILFIFGVNSQKINVTSISSTIYGIPNQIVTISGEYFGAIYSVKIGGIDCTDLKYTFDEDGEYLKCHFISTVGSITSKLDVELFTESQLITYKNNFKYDDYEIPLYTYVSFISSTIYGIPNQIVTIYGGKFNTIKTITIGGTNCAGLNYTFDPEEEMEIIQCNFISNVGNVSSELPVILYDSNASITPFTFESFLYEEDEPCPSNDDDIICSGISNGQCNNQTRECDCNKGYGGFDCSTIINSDIPIPKPMLNQAFTIMETNSTRFNIGIIEIHEIDPLNTNLPIRKVDLKLIQWNTFETLKSNITTYHYDTTIDSNCTISISILVYNNYNTNNGSSVSFNFLGDKLKILPSSVKYQVEISKWEFKSKLNLIQVLFESQINDTEKSECQKQQEIKNNIRKSGESIRTIEMKLINGQTLVGTFSNRMSIDGRVIASKIDILPNTNTNNNNKLIQVVSIGNFNNKVIIDPNFGLLLSSPSPSNGNSDQETCNEEIIDGDNNNNNSNGNNRKWILPISIVVSVIGASVILISGALVYKKYRNTNVMINIRMKLPRS